ncbi:MAG: glycoside hydrolase family 9 protein [Lachnospiraceae bacterium]|nr:glycoside hydrolase family 9 protein [Lachnospiraceae bacterium]
MQIINYLKNKKNITKTAVFLITVIIAIAPVISRYCINGHDLEYHLLRIESLKEGILMGMPFLKVNVLFFGGAGYASSMFYPDFLLYLPALLRVAGVSINNSYHIFVAVCIILCYISTYLCVKNMTDSTYAGMIAAVVITLCPYHLDDIYIRSAVGEYTAFIFIPIIIYSIYNIVFEEMDKPQLFILGYAGILLCHTSTFIMCTIFGFIVLVINIKKIFREKKLFIKIIISVLITLMITCFYWLPMLEQFMDTAFYVSVPWMEPKNEAVDFFRIFGNVFPSMGSLCILLLIPRLFLKNKEIHGEEIFEEDNNKVSKKVKENVETGIDHIICYSDILILLGIFFMIMASNILPWDRLGNYLSFIQFPWRFFIMSSSLFSVSAGLIYSKIAGMDKDTAKIWIFDKDGDSTVADLGIIILTVLLFINGIIVFNDYGAKNQGYYDYSDDYYSYKPYTANVIAGEWLPLRVTDKDTLVSDSEKMIASDGTEIGYKRIKNYIIADIKDTYDYIDVPFIYYKGYEAEYTLENGEKSKLSVTGSGNNGMCRVYPDGRGKGELKVFYKGTIIIKIAMIISIITVLVIFIIFLGKKKRMFFIVSLLILSVTGCRVENTDKVTLEDNDNDKDNLISVSNNLAEKDSIIRINLSGYELYGSKKAILEGNGEELSFSVINEKDNEEIFNGEIRYDKKANDDGLIYGVLDFTLLEKEGNYYIKTDTGYESGVFEIKDELYKDLLAESKKQSEKNIVKSKDLNSENIKKIILRMTDCLLEIEFFEKYDSESMLKGLKNNQNDNVSGDIIKLKKEIDLFKDQIDENGELKFLSVQDPDILYSYSAVLSLFAYENKDYDKSYSEDCIKLSELVYKKAEEILRNNGSKDDQVKDKRFWASAQLYKYTAKKEYRKVAEEYALDPPKGFNKDKSGYLGTVAYLTCYNKIDLNVGDKLITRLMDDINYIVKASSQNNWLVMTGNEKEENIEEILEAGRLLVLGNYITKNIKYVETCENQLAYLCGRNKDGEYYIFSEDTQYQNEANKFILAGLVDSYIYENKKVEDTNR